MQEDQDKASWMNSIPPKSLFIGGIVGGILVICTLGFFILLGMTLRGGSAGTENWGAKADDGKAAVAVAPTPDAGAAPTVGKPTSIGSDDHVLGDSSAKVTLFEYSDYQCPYCQRFEPVAMQLLDAYKGKIRLVYRSFPLSSIHPQAQRSAEAAECIASLKGNTAYWKYGTLLFQNQDSLGDTLYGNLATQVGADKAALLACLNSGKFTAKVKAMEAEGEKIGVQGTPATFVVAADGSVELMGGALPFEQAKAYVDRALAK
ncbi:MAG: thioredoxin domain-containing protein [Candidatus Magasanikbacteria bacterium]|nr:thioredoxin domain-containing protein [Candidatus Magasanikbacteria bacterium]